MICVGVMWGWREAERVCWRLYRGVANLKEGTRGGSYEMGSGRAAAAAASRRGSRRESTSRRVGAPLSTVAPPGKGR